jgi:hypothetical protein
MTHLFRILLLGMMAIIAVLPGCGGGSSQVAGIDRGGLHGGAVGSVSGFGSVIVNGIHYETGSAVINVNGLPATEADLEVGYVVVIQADIPESGSSLQATSIDFSHDVIGPLTAVDVANNRGEVLGQTIRLNDSTNFGPGISPASVDGLALLTAGQVLRISGFVGFDGEILASRIDLGVDATELEVVGIVTNLDTAISSFEIGGLVVNYQGANLDGFVDGRPSNGDRVKAGGVRLDMAGELIATTLELKDLGGDFEEDDELEVEGLITAFTSASSFSVSGIPVSTNAATEYSGGDASMLALNIRVEVEGQLNSNGVLVAAQVEFRSDGDLRVEAMAEVIDAAAGTLEILGIAVQTNTLTSFEDKSPAELRPFSLADINLGDSLRVVGTESVDALDTIVATKIVRMEKLEGLRLKGVAANVAAPSFSILGVTIFTDNQTDIEDNFFTIAEGRRVEAAGDNGGGQFLADKVEFKD